MKWTSEKVAKLSTEQIKALRANATQRGEEEVARMCDDELTRNRLRKASKTPQSDSKSRPVQGFHFICPKELGVQWDDSHFRTGIWVVDEKHVIAGIKIGAYVALHESKSKPSYQQGTIVDYEIKPRQGKKIPNGIEFLVEPSDKPLQWHGDGAGERGYYYGE